MNPFLTFYTPTYRRPRALAACMASVEKQTLAAQIEHVIIADYVGIGIGGMYQRVPQYAEAVHGDYVHVLADDDELHDKSVVEQVRDFAVAQGYPAVILVDVVKIGMGLIVPSWPPVEGEIDLGNMIVRGDVWQRHCGDYGKRYEGDADFARSVHRAGYEAERLPVMFLTGGVRHGAPEVIA